MLVVAEDDVGADLDRRLEDERQPFLGLDDVHVGIGQRDDVLLDEGLAIGGFDGVLDRVVEDRRPDRDAAPGRLEAPCPGGNPGTRVRLARCRTASSIDRVRRSGGSSISSTTVDLAAGVLVICIARAVYRRTGPGQRQVIAPGLESRKRLPGAGTHPPGTHQSGRPAPNVDRAWRRDGYHESPVRCCAIARTDRRPGHGRTRNRLSAAGAGCRLIAHLRPLHHTLRNPQGTTQRTSQSTTRTMNQRTA